MAYTFVVVAVRAAGQKVGLVSKVSVMNPWYVVQTFRTLAQLGEMYYYTAMETDTPEAFTEDPKKALLFMNLYSAARVARSEGAHIRVLVDEDDVKEFGR